MGIMAIFNLIAIIFLGKYAFSALKDYIRQKKAGKDPIFYATNIPNLHNTECWNSESTKEKIG